jgi:hypothetical protein
MRRSSHAGDEPFDLAGIAVSGAAITFRQPARQYIVPSEAKIALSGEFSEALRVINIHHLRDVWPWVKKPEIPVLAYRYLHEATNWSPRSRGCLKDFVSLAKTPEERFSRNVLAFARNWGVLRICEHGKPSGHFNDCAPISHRESAWYTEPLEAWRRYARQLRGLLLIAAKLRLEELGEPEDWRAVNAGEPSMVGDNQPSGMEFYIPQSDLSGEIWGPEESNGATVRRLREERFHVAHAVGHWFRYGSVRLYPQWHWETDGNHRFVVETLYGGLHGKLAVELAAALSSENGIYQCAGCGDPFVSEDRKRDSTRNTWCDSQECQSEQLRQNSRRYYENKKRTRKLRAKGNR